MVVATRRDEHHEFAEHHQMLQCEALGGMLIAVSVTAFGLLWAAAVWPPQLPLEPLPLVTALMLSVLLTTAARRWAQRFVTMILVVTLSATLTGAILWYPSGHAVAGFALVVLAANGAADWRHGLLAALIGTTIVLTIAQWQPELVPPDLKAQALLLIWGALALSWLGARRLQTAYAWAWQHYVLAHQQATEAQRQRSELVRLAKSLNEACDRLERLNVELKEAREAAEMARRLKAEFAATVGHELRTPINLIIGFSELMVGEGRSVIYGEDLPESYHRDLEAICRNANHISHLVDDILDLSQVDAHRMALRKEQLVLRKVIQDAIANVETFCVDEGLSLTIDVPLNLPAVHADPVRIRQVLINLLFNAIRFTHQGGLTVRARCDASNVIVSVIDTGIGIPPSDLERVFEEFRHTLLGSHGRGGSGLGLAVCKRFVELHGGNIWAESIPGFGSTFSFSLPMHDNVVPIPGRLLPEAGARMVPHAPRIGVLDPVGDAARILGRYLDGYRIRPIASPDVAQMLIAEGEIEVLIVTSLKVAHEWRERLSTKIDLPPVPTILCTLRTREHLAETLHVTDYLVKPITRERLALGLRRLGKPINKVVVIEDNPDMGDLLERALHSLSSHCQVALARDGATGLNLVREVRPDVILLDLLMPELDGYNTVEQLRAVPDLCNIPVIVVTAKGLDEEVMASKIEVTRPTGMSVMQTMRCLKANLDVLLQPRGTARVPQEVSGG